MAVGGRHRRRTGQIRATGCGLPPPPSRSCRQRVIDGRDKTSFNGFRQMAATLRPASSASETEQGQPRLPTAKGAAIDGAPANELAQPGPPSARRLLPSRFAVCRSIVFVGREVDGEIRACLVPDARWPWGGTALIDLGGAAPLRKFSNRKQRIRRRRDATGRSQRSRRRRPPCLPPLPCGSLLAVPDAFPSGPLSIGTPFRCRDRSPSRPAHLARMTRPPTRIHASGRLRQPSFPASPASVPTAPSVGATVLLRKILTKTLPWSSDAVTGSWPPL